MSHSMVEIIALQWPFGFSSVATKKPIQEACNCLPNCLIWASMLLIAAQCFCGCWWPLRWVWSRLLQTLQCGPTNLVFVVVCFLLIGCSFHVCFGNLFVGSWGRNYEVSCFLFLSDPNVGPLCKWKRNVLCKCKCCEFLIGNWKY